MKKKIIAAAAALAAAGTAWAEKGPIYISPNNDGVQDFLEVPIKIRDKRYVKEWSFVIENESGEVVRTIGNKDKREGGMTFLGFFKQLFTPKSGVDIPKTVLWNGALDSGEIAPDGTYRYYMRATDDNGNTAETKKLLVVVDNTPPEIALEQPSSEDKIFGEGSKVTFSVQQGGSKEDLWTGVFMDARGNPVLTRKWTESEPLPFEWNGTDDGGAILPDGVYSYKVGAVDRAGNQSEPATISNIIYSSEKPVASIALAGGRYFNKELELEVKVPVPDAKSPNKLESWKVEVTNADGKVVRSYSGKGEPPADGGRIVWNGADAGGKQLPEGAYQATVSAKYTNGFETAPASSPTFTLDRTAPTATLKAASLTFSPDGDGNLDTLEIAQKFGKESLSPVENWTGRILDSNGKTVKEYQFGAFPPEKLSWDGTDSSNQPAADGTYSYQLVATDAAGNDAKVSPVAGIKLDTSKTELLLALSRNSFNPKKPDAIKLSPVVKATSRVSSYEISILDSESREVWSQSGKTLPASFSWNGNGPDGAVAADGEYVALIQISSENGAETSAKSKKFTIDTVPPQLSLDVKYTLFSPDGDNRKDGVPFGAESSDEGAWTATLYDQKGAAVKTYSWKGKVPAFEWDGTDGSGNVLPDGKYKLVFESEDEAGNRTRSEVENLEIDNREAKAYVTAEHDAFSPNGDGSFDEQKFTLRPTLADGIEKWTFRVKDGDGKVVRTWSGSGTLPREIVWDGKDDAGKPASDNVYTGSLSALYDKGNLVETDSAAFISCATPPKLSVKTQPQFFSPDNDGEDDDLFIQLRGESVLPLKSWSFQINDPKGNKFWSTAGKSSITEQIIWDGKSNSGEIVQSATDYPYVFTVTDSLGMTSEVKGEINVDILVIKVGDRLKMAVPSIIFRSDAADFGIRKVDSSGKVVKSGITPAQAATNERVLRRIAEILNKFKDYQVTVEGHANSQSGTRTEEEKDTAQYGPGLLKLSKQRAEFVKGKLKEYGVKADRLSTIGKGGTEPIVSRTDKDNNWKNRRVEFILDKNK